MITFKNMDEYEAWTEQFDNCSDYQNIPTAIDDGNKLSIDMFTECKSWKIALRRFEKTFGKVDKTVSGWVEEMRESAESGYSKGCWEPGYGWTKEEIEESRRNGTFSWGIEQYDSEWYIFLNVSGIYREA